LDSTDKRIRLLNVDGGYIEMDDYLIYCITVENASYIAGLEENVFKLQEENKLLKRRLNDMRELHGLYGNH